MIPILTGLAAGTVHVFSGADHLAALAPLAIKDPTKAGRRGAMWGLGHGTTILLVGTLSVALRSFVNVEAWSAWAEFVVGFLLLGIGAWAIRVALKTEVHSHPHLHSDEAHVHLHSHSREQRRHDHAAFGVGVLHGMAGTGYLFGVLPALALALSEAMLYLSAYLVASVVAMSGFAFLLGLMTRRSGPDWVRRIMMASGALALALGVVWIVISWPF